MKNASWNRKKQKRKGNVSALVWTLAIVLALGIGVILIITGRSGRLNNTIENLIAENKYAEAYRTAVQKGTSKQAKHVCEEAADYYLSQGEYKNAYVFANIVGNGEKVAKAATDEVRLSGKGAAGSEAFSVARLSEDKAGFNEALASVIRDYENERDYFTALDVSDLAFGDEEKSRLSASVFQDGLAYYSQTSNNEEKLFRLISVYCSPDGSETLDESSVKPVIERFVSEGKKAEAFIISDHFGMDSSDIEVTPCDPSVAKQLCALYPILTEEQKRTFHSTPVAYFKETFYIKDGVLFGTAITDAISVCTHEIATVVMHRDGSVSVFGINGRETGITIPSDVRGVKAVCGLGHAVVLKADGTCEAFGNNDFGQCGVSEWTDIIDVAAGRYFTLGLKSDGTCVACGSNRSGQCDVSGFRNVTGIGACDQSSVVVFSDGTAAIAGYRSMGLDGVKHLNGVVNVVCGSTFIAARFENGLYTIVDGTVEGSAGDADVLSGCLALSAGTASIAYLDAYGNLKYTGSGSPADNKLNG